MRRSLGIARGDTGGSYVYLPHEPYLFCAGARGHVRERARRSFFCAGKRRAAAAAGCRGGGAATVERADSAASRLYGEYVRAERLWAYAS